MTLHLTVFQANGETNAHQFDSHTNDFQWNDNGSAFLVIPLRWWDDTSYIAYQGDCND